MAAVVPASAAAAPAVHTSASVAPAVVQSQSVAPSITHATSASVAVVVSTPAVVSASVSQSTPAVQSAIASSTAPSTTASSHKPASTSSSVTSTSTASASTSSSSTHGLNNGAIIAICVIVGVCAIVALFSIRRWIVRRKTNRETELPPPNNSFFQPYWRSSHISANNTLNRQQGTDGESSMKHEVEYNVPLHYNDLSGPPTESSRDSWRKSIGDGLEMESGLLTGPSPLGTESPLVPPATISDPFLNSSPNTSLTSLPTPHDQTALNSVDLASSSTNVPPDDFSPSRTESPRPGTNDSRTESLRPHVANTSQSRRVRSPLEEHNRRQSTHSMASGYSERRNSVIRGPPHKSNMQIILPQPLAPNLASTLVDPIGSTPPPSAYGNRNVNNRRSRADMWAETLSRSHTPGPPSATSHADDHQPSRKGTKSGDSEGLHAGPIG
ncbi:hypothetical protein FRB97_007553 [Tulasnella sp. 331]|nr:hypothetical protein FRB97_007553 [Tulasnella sp. 331]KAG8878240.1 hypothetical protein FRB98_006306 [Tulasnella sp. 332]